MKLLADEGVDKPIVDLLRSSGFDVHYILESNRGCDDESILRFANEEDRLLITQDKDFGELVYRLRKAHQGVILIRLTTMEAIQKAETVLYVILNYQDKLIGAFTVIQPNAVRIRPQQ